MRSPSVVWRSIGISSLSTKRRRPALRIRSSSGSSKSMPSYSLPPHHAHVDRDRAFGAALRPHHEWIDLDVLYSRAVIEEETAERQRGRLERRAIGRGPPAKARQQPGKLEAADHRSDLFRRDRQEP